MEVVVRNADSFWQEEVSIMLRELKSELEDLIRQELRPDFDLDVEIARVEAFVRFTSGYPDRLRTAVIFRNFVLMRFPASVNGSVYQGVCTANLVIDTTPALIKDDEEFPFEEFPNASDQELVESYLSELVDYTENLKDLSEFVDYVFMTLEPNESTMEVALMLER